MNKEKIFDFNRSKGSSAHKIFGALSCDKCEQPSDILYQFRLNSGEPSEDSYCEKCHDELTSQSAAKT